MRYHDLHHVATGYPTTWRGEFEISAWEIASGCAGHPFAWIINASGFTTGLFIWPGAVWRAFVRGRHSGNLYRTEWSEVLLDQTVADLRHSLRLDGRPPRARLADRLAFATWAAGVVLAVGALGFGVVALV